MVGRQGGMVMSCLEGCPARHCAWRNMDSNQNHQSSKRELQMVISILSLTLTIRGLVDCFEGSCGGVR